MGQQVDAVIIGAGVIGTATAFELGKRGYKTLNIDKLPSAGYGPTSNSCAIVRAHYSSFDGVAMAYEGFFYWKNWAEYLEAPDESGLAKYMQSGTILLESATGHHDKVLPHYDRLGVPYEEWDTATLERKVPIFDVHEFWPPSRPSDDDFAAPRERKLPGAIYTPDSGYVNDPALSSHNLQRASEAKGGQYLYRRKVTEIRQAGGKVLGVTLDDGSEIDAKIVVNVAGPHSFVINRMAGVEDGMKIKTKALRHEVHHVPSPPGFDYEKDGHHVSDGDNAIYFRPETGNHILIGSEDPGLRPAGVGREPRRLQPPGHARAVGGPGLSLRPAHPGAADPRGHEGRRRSLRLLGRLDPDLRQERSGRLLHGRRHEWQSVQERPRRRALHGRVDRRRREGP